MSLPNMPDPKRSEDVSWSVRSFTKRESAAFEYRYSEKVIRFPNKKLSRHFEEKDLFVFDFKYIDLLEI